MLHKDNVIPIKYFSTFNYNYNHFDIELNDIVNTLVINTHRLVIKNMSDLNVKKEGDYTMSIRIGESWLNFEKDTCSYKGYFNYKEIIKLLKGKIDLELIKEEPILKAIPIIYNLANLESILYEMYNIKINKKRCIVKKDKYLFFAPNCIYFSSNMEEIVKRISAQLKCENNSIMHYYYDPVTWYKGKRENQLTWPKVTKKKPRENFIEYPENSKIYYYGKGTPGLKKLRYTNRCIPVLNHKNYTKKETLKLFQYNDKNVVQILNKEHLVEYILTNRLIYQLDELKEYNEEYKYWPYNYKELIADAVLNNNYSISKEDILTIPNIGIYDNSHIIVPNILKFITEEKIYMSKTNYLITLKSQKGCRIKYDYD